MDNKIYAVKKIDIVALIILFVSAFLVFRIGILGGFNIGFSIGVLIAMVTVIFYAPKNSKGNRLFIVIFSMLIILLILSFSLGANFLTKVCTVLFLPFSFVILVSAISGNVSFLKGDYQIVLGAVVKFFDSAILKIDIPFKSYFNKFAGNNSKKIGYGLVGGLISVPVSIVVLSLLTSSDIAFENLVGELLENIGLLVISLIFAVVVTPFVYSYLFNTKKLTDENKQTKSFKGFADSALFNVILIVVSFVYIAYAVSQLAYITKAFSFLLPEDFTAAEFARSGFFQMGLISFINFILISLSAVFVKRKNKGKIPAFTKALLMFISVFSIFYISTAIIKMLKYISLYGLTSLRVLTSVFMVMLAIIFIILLLRFITPKVKYAKAVLVTCTLALVLVSVIDINPIIAEYNYREYKKGNIEIDMEQLSELNEGGMPVLYKLTKEKDKEISDKALHYFSGNMYLIYNNALDKDDYRENGLDVTKKYFYEKNSSWIKAKEAVDEFFKENPDFDYYDFEDSYYKTYENDGYLESEDVYVEYETF